MRRSFVLCTVASALLLLIGLGSAVPTGSYDSLNTDPFSFAGVSTTVDDQVAATKNKRQAVVEDPVFIPLGQKQTNLFKAYSFVWTHLNKNKGGFIEYPYAFTRTDLNESFPEGALIANSDTTPTGNTFQYLAATTDITLSRAKAIYDSSIAILSISASFSGAVRDLTYEGSRYCSALHDYITGKWTNCYTGSEYTAALAANPDFESTSIVYVSASDLTSGILKSRFGILVIPDIYAGSETAIKDALGTAGISAIQSFVNKGGLLYASGKGALVASAIGVLPGTTFDSTNLLGVRGLRAAVSDCTGASGTSTEMDWVSGSLCFGVPRDANNSNNAFVTLYSAPIVTAVGGLRTISTFMPATNMTYYLQDRNTGVVVPAPAFTKNTYPYLLAKQMGLGFVVVDLANPATDSKSYPWFYNAIFLANSRPIIVDTRVLAPFSVLPALEQFGLSINVRIQNLYNFELTNFREIIWIASGLDLISFPGTCTLVNRTQTSSLTPPSGEIDSSRYLDCTPGTHSLAAFAELGVNVSLFIRDVSITSAGRDITMIWPQIWYTDMARGGKGLNVTADYGAITIDTFLAAVLRTELNVDPAGMYPIWGSGAYIDNVLHAENTENTEAVNVKYISVVPLISPVVDGDNMQKISHQLDFDYLYYQASTNKFGEYKYPFSSPAYPYTTGQVRDVDFLDFRLLYNRSNHLVGDWDTPIKNFKIPRNASFPNLPLATPSDVSNGGLTTTVDSGDKLVAEYFFPDCNNFYETATIRLLVFLDTTTPNAFASYDHPSTWTKHSGVVESWRLAETGGRRMRSNLVFTHVDYYFYDVMQKYPLPLGIDSTDSVFTIDRWNNGAIPNSCSSGDLGSQFSKIVQQGYFGNSYADGSHFPPGLAPSEYNNGLFSICKKQKLTWDNVETQTGGKVTKTHYVVPLTDNPEIVTGDDIMYFTKDTAAKSIYAPEWYYNPAQEEPRMGTYPELRAVWVYHAQFQLSPNDTRKGGRVVFDIPCGFEKDPIANECITVQPDQVATVGISQVSGKIAYQFKRGLMPNEAWGQPSNMMVNFEHLATNVSSFTVQADIQEMTYDLSLTNTNTPQHKFEKFTHRAYVSVTFTRVLAISFPALKMEFQLLRKNSTVMMPYESLEPFVRVGTYAQELKQHATIWADPEVHLNKPAGGQGIVGKGGDLVYPTTMGISPIPFAEFLQTGSKQLIPSSVENSRVEWDDIWGRTFSQPVRSVYPDNAPIPSPLRNFMMTTTFEVLSPSSTTRDMIWQSDQPKTVRVQAKLLNNYRKWFDPTTCKDNQVLNSHNHGRIYDNSVVNVNMTGKNTFALVGHRSSYGVCLNTAPTVLEGQTLSSEQMTNINGAANCLDGNDWYAKCPWAQTSANYPHLKRSTLDPSGGESWMSIPETKSHYPSGYIKPKMWDMTEVDYEDTWFDKGNPWHMDNQLPSIDGGTRPLNIVALPIYKGMGYEMEYDKSNSHSKFPGKKGWWSDNLQNRDNTLLAGNAKSNDVSVGQDDLTKDVGWVAATDLQPSQNSRLKNIYVCEFNRYRIALTDSNPVQSYPPNVVINNIVPIDHTLTKNDAKLTNYNCDLSKPMYFPENISQFGDNIVQTETAKDWMYFGANLRAQGLETVNVLYNLNPSSRKGVYQEGMTKINEGGRFVYWNPALGPNTFLVVDDLVSVVMARRTDVQVEHYSVPSETSTFNSSVIHVIDMKDEAEIGRTWDSPIYYNYYGFGDSAVSVYVGGYNATTAILSPGSETHAEVVFYNNAGFDWNLKANAINSTDMGSKPINANDLLYNLVHAIKVPTSYNFLTTTFAEPELANYVSIVPSGHNADTAPLFFDFENINVASIRDGFKGRYFYKIKVAANVPAKFKGKMHAIKVGIVQSYFDALPGFNDPTPSTFANKYHDYKLAVPDIVFGIPYGSEQPNYAGGVYWTSGHAKNLKLVHHVDTKHTPTSAYIVNDDYIDELAEITGNPLTLISSLKTFWEKVQSKCKQVPFTVVPATADYNTVVFNLTKFGTQFPFGNASGGPEIAEVKIMLNTFAAQLAPGRFGVTELSQSTFNDDVNQAKQDASTVLNTVTVIGPFLQLQLSGAVMDEDMNVIVNQTITEATTGYVRLNITAVNVGNGIAYHTDLKFDIPSTLNVKDTSGYKYSLKSIANSGLSSLTLLTDMTMAPGDIFSASVLFHFGSAKTNDKAAHSRRLFLNMSHGMMDLSQTPGELRVTQDLSQAYSVPMATASAGGWSGGVWFAVIGLPIIAVGAAAAAIIAAAVVASRKRESHYEARETTVTQKQKKKASVPKTGSAANVPSPVVSVGPDGRPKYKVADTNYIMSGGRPVKVADGNPTAIDDGPDSSEEDGETTVTGKITRWFQKLGDFILCKTCKEK